jgi:hypothetical protein
MFRVFADDPLERRVARGTDCDVGVVIGPPRELQLGEDAGGVLLRRIPNHVAGHQLAQLSVEEPYRSRGITWVTSRPPRLSFLVGFCAVETQDHAAAERFLTVATGLAPLLAAPRLKLAHALILQRKLDAADDAVDLLLRTTQDRCSLGGAWRKRGYIRFEQGRLEDARSACTRSLD